MKPKEDGGLLSSHIYAQWKEERGRDYTSFKTFSTDDQTVALALHWTIIMADDDGVGDTDHTGSRNRNRIRLAVAVRARGWGAVGIAEMGGMAGSDILVFEVNGLKLYDAYATASERPKIDKQQDWTLLNASWTSVEDEIILFEAERKVITDDPMDWPIIVDTNPFLPGTRIIAAWGDTEEMHYHGPDNRLQGNVRFYDGTFSNADTSPVNPAVGSFDNKQDYLHSSSGSGSISTSILFNVDNFVVPGRWTTWYEHRCFTVTELINEQGLPSDQPLHAIAFEALLDPGQLVHHMSLYSSPSEEHMKKKCDENGPHEFMYVWNKGQDKMTLFPNDVGVLLADTSSSMSKDLGQVPRSFRLEIHYENPKKLKGIHDSSGIRVHYTSELRTHTAAIMEVGDPRVKLVNNPIGEGLQDHKFMCNETCTRNHIPQGGVIVLYEMLHMHKSGLTMQNIHKRKGKEIRRSVVQYYDFDQGAQVVKQEPFQILPGDSFETHCLYQGMKGLQFGFEAHREMCMGWILYYPAMDVHLSCSYQSGVESCAAVHTSARLPGPSELGRTFGQERSNGDVEFRQERGRHSSDEGIFAKNDIPLSAVFVITISVVVVAIIMIAFSARKWYSLRVSRYKKVTRDEMIGCDLGSDIDNDGWQCPVGVRGASHTLRYRAG